MGASYIIELGKLVHHYENQVKLGQCPLLTPMLALPTKVLAPRLVKTQLISKQKRIIEKLVSYGRLQ
jgi:hypothetical protein